MVFQKKNKLELDENDLPSAEEELGLTNPVTDYTVTETYGQVTTWKNNTDNVARFRLPKHEKIGGKKGNCQGTTFLDVVVKPGQSIRLPSEYDMSIRYVKNDIVLQGLCPWLTKVGEEKVVMHKALDYKQSILEMEVNKELERQESEDRLAKALELVKKKNAAAQHTG